MKKRILLIPIRTMAKIEEVDNCIDFLISEKNTLIANETINISGGE